MKTLNHTETAHILDAMLKLGKRINTLNLDLENSQSRVYNESEMEFSKEIWLKDTEREEREIRKEIYSVKKTVLLLFKAAETLEGTANVVCALLRK